MSRRNDRASLDSMLSRRLAPVKPPRRRLLAAAAAFGVALVAAAGSGTASAAPLPTAGRGVPVSQDDLFLAARDAFRAGDRARLAQLAPGLARHPLAIWVDFWQLQMRLRSDAPARVDADVAAFFARYPDTYLADRLRFEWLLALALRGDFARFAAEQPALVWQRDDAQLRCWNALLRYRGDDGAADERALGARRVLAGARDTGSDGCLALTDALLADGQLARHERIRALVESNQLTAARHLAAALPRAEAAQVTQAIEQAGRFLLRNQTQLAALPRAVVLLAVARLARDDPPAAARYAAQIDARLTPAQRGALWGRIGHMGAVKLLPEALDWYRRGGDEVGAGLDAARADEVLEWQMRAALRGDARGPDWTMLRATFTRMSEAQQADPTWIYWNARALAAGGHLQSAQAAFRSIAGSFSFYGKLAAEEVGLPIVIPPAAPAPAADAVAQHASNAGMARALKLADLGLRVEGAREWAWQLRGRSDAELLAIAEYARGAGALDRMIATSDRTRELFDFGQRFPAPHRDELVRHAQALALDETWIYGLIRQESRFIRDARSTVGAQGLMQLMPATARYVARRVGLSDYQPARIAELEVNLQLGTNYLKLVLDDLDGNPILATAAYNAGPGRARAWRASLPRAVEGAIFVESIPFNETRDYVKKVMSNTVYYAALFDDRAQSLKARLGSVAPKAAGATELP